MRIGIGYDVHQLREGLPLILGGVEIPFTKGLLGHSDADVLTHAMMDAILGALNLGSIGDHFPDTDPKYKGISSITLLKHVTTLMKDKGMEIVNIDSVIIAEQPKLKPYIPEIQAHLASIMAIPKDDVSVKATTTEKLGFTGREEGIAVETVVLLKKSS